MVPAVAATATKATTVLLRQFLGSGHHPPAGDQTQCGYGKRGVAPYIGTKHEEAEMGERSYEGRSYTGRRAGGQAAAMRAGEPTDHRGGG